MGLFNAIEKQRKNPLDYFLQVSRIFLLIALKIIFKNILPLWAKERNYLFHKSQICYQKKKKPKIGTQCRDKAVATNKIKIAYKLQIKSAVKRVKMQLNVFSKLLP